MISIKKALFAFAGAAMLASTAVSADVIEVKGKGVQFDPVVIHAKVGDTIAFRNMPTHFVDIVQGMWPEGAPKMLSAMGADYDYQVEKEGLYVYKCPPHWGARMGGIMVVGEPADLNAVIDQYLKVAEENAEAKPAKGLLTKFKESLGK
jgi:pseudoazurin